MTADPAAERPRCGGGSWTQRGWSVGQCAGVAGHRASHYWACPGHCARLALPVQDRRMACDRRLVFAPSDAGAVSSVFRHPGDGQYAREHLVPGCARGARHSPPSPGMTTGNPGLKTGRGTPLAGARTSCPRFCCLPLPSSAFSLPRRSSKAATTTAASPRPTPPISTWHGSLRFRPCSRWSSSACSGRSCGWARNCFDLINLDFLESLIEHKWFSIPATPLPSRPRSMSPTCARGWFEAPARWCSRWPRGCCRCSPFWSSGFWSRFFSPGCNPCGIRATPPACCCSRRLCCCS